MRGWLANWQKDKETGGQRRRRSAAAGSDERRVRLGRMALGTALWLALNLMGARAWAQRQPMAQPDESDAMSEMSSGPSPTLRQQQKATEVLPPPSGMTFTPYLDHTAVWVGDRFRYSIIVDHTPNYEFVLDTLSKETVNMDPFQVVDVAKRTVPLKNGNSRLYLDLTLTSFATGKPSEQIPQLTLFYFKKERGSVRPQEAAAESLTVPGPVVGLRTTLPPSVTDIRDAITVTEWPRSRWVVAGIGTFSMILLVVGVGWETVAFLRRRQSQRGPDRRKAMREVRDRWLSAVPADFSNTETTVRFVDQSYQDLKEFLGYYLETPTTGLTAEELQEQMQRLGADRDLSERAVRALGELEISRYSQNGTAPNPEVARKTAQEIREIFAQTAR